MFAGFFQRIDQQPARLDLVPGALVDRGQIRPSDRVVVVSTAHGLKFVDFKVRYHDMELPGVASGQANPPIELPNDYAQVRERMLREIDLRFSH